MTGLWHGASWNFVLWGLYFGALVILEKWFFLRVLEKLPRIFSHLYLIFAVVIGWSLFYFTDLSRLGRFLQVLFGASGAGLWDVQLEVVLINNLFWLAIALVGCLPLVPWGKKKWQMLSRPKWASRLENCASMGWDLVLLFLCTAFLAGQSYNPFLYFRF